MKSSKKRIYRPHDYMKALVMCLIVGILCMFITRPILMGAVRYNGIQSSIDLVALDAEKYGWTDERTALSKEYEAEREAMAKENVVIDWCYKNSKTTFCAVIRNINIGICALIFIFGAGLTLFSAYCIGRDVRECGIPYIANVWRCVNVLVKSSKEEAKKSKITKKHAEIYKQFGLEMK